MLTVNLTSREFHAIVSALRFKRAEMYEKAMKTEVVGNVQSNEHNSYVYEYRAIEATLRRLRDQSRGWSL